MSDELKKYVDKHRELFDNKEPSDELWNKIRTTIPSPQPATIPIRKKWNVKYWGIAASTIILIGTAVYFTQNNPVISTKPIIVNNSKKSSHQEKKEEKKEVIATEGKVAKKQDVILVKNEEKVITTTPHQIQENNTSKIDHQDREIIQLLEDQNSTSNRINAIAKLGEAGTLSEQEIYILKERALHDENTIVRLNAIEVLISKLSESSVEQEMTSLFLEQDNPMVQMELIGIISHLNKQPNQELISKLHEIILNPKTQPFVKDEAYAVLLKKEIKQ
ncbi:HEAT repeat domain-containing protein [Empedobacter brevis]|uniref:HEAT repeat domain-containing protein n=1 Tax=Empedobacter brevis TaxID=247 RepID=UPI00123CE317|nr:HEAT repeat domain-containing protein [Empedobacter brevis]QES91322.1 HEAT repeat domain-containing protein [Empedobacter brevis]